MPAVDDDLSSCHVAPGVGCEPRGLRVMYLLGFQSIDLAAEYRANVAAAVHEALARGISFYDESPVAEFNA